MTFFKAEMINNRDRSLQLDKPKKNCSSSEKYISFNKTWFIMMKTSTFGSSCDSEDNPFWCYLCRWRDLSVYSRMPFCSDCLRRLRKNKCLPQQPPEWPFYSDSHNYIKCNNRSFLRHLRLVRHPSDVAASVRNDLEQSRINDWSGCNAGSTVTRGPPWQAAIFAKYQKKFLWVDIHSSYLTERFAEATFIWDIWKSGPALLWWVVRDNSEWRSGIKRKTLE